MPKRVRNAVALVVMGVFIGTTGYLIIMAPAGDPWRKLISEFQTLIGGLLAVLAAWWTIATMERTDRAAQKRHDQLMAQQTRPDALKVERFIATEFPNIGEAILRLEAHSLPVGLSALEIVSNFRQEANSVAGCLNWARSFPIQANWKACAALFGGPLERDWQEFEALALTASQAGSAAEYYAAPDYAALHVSNDRAKVQERDAEVRLSIEALPAQVDAAIEKLRQVEAHFLELAHLYGVKPQA